MRGYYVGPVILAEDKESQDKQRFVKIYKSEVFGDIDNITFKHVDAREDLGRRSSNAVSSDVSEHLDGNVVARYVELQDAELRSRYRDILVEVEQETADDTIPEERTSYDYYFEVAETFKDNLLRPLAEYIHHFLVWGALYLWYGQFGSPQANFYKGLLDDLNEKLDDILRSPSIVKRPLQPFGPANPYPYLKEPLIP